VDLDALADELDEEEIDTWRRCRPRTSRSWTSTPTPSCPTTTPDMELPQGRPTPAEARQMLVEMVEQLAAAGRTTITVRDLPDPEQAFGRGRPWLSGQLGRLVQDGVLTEAGVDGKATVYAFRARDAA